MNLFWQNVLILFCKLGLKGRLITPGNLFMSIGRKIFIKKRYGWQLVGFQIVFLFKFQLIRIFILLYRMTICSLIFISVAWLQNYSVPFFRMFKVWSSFFAVHHVEFVGLYHQVLFLETKLEARDCLGPSTMTMTINNDNGWLEFMDNDWLEPRDNDWPVNRNNGWLEPSDNDWPEIRDNGWL